MTDERCVKKREACTRCHTGKAEDQCARCESWICFDHVYVRGEGDNISEELYCIDCVNEHDDPE